MKIPIDPKLAVEALKPFVRQWDEFLNDLGNDPEVNLKIAKFAKATGLDDYPLLYLDSQNLIKITLLSLFPVEQVKDLNEYCNTLSYEHAVEYANRTVENLNTSPEKLDAILDPLLSRDSTEVDLTQLSIQEKCAITAFFLWFHEIISFAVHGHRLTHLVQRAVNGDDEALCLAAQTDSLVMTIPYFRERMLDALQIKSDADAQFIYNLSYRLQNPLLRGKISHRKAWLALFLLDTMALLDGQLTHAEILDMLEAAGIDNLGSEDNLAKILRNYRSNQQPL